MFKIIDISNFLDDSKIFKTVFNFEYKNYQFSYEKINNKFDLFSCTLNDELNLKDKRKLCKESLKELKKFLKENSNSIKIYNNNCLNIMKKEKENLFNLNMDKLSYFVYSSDNKKTHIFYDDIYRTNYEFFINENIKTFSIAMNLPSYQNNYFSKGFFIEGNSSDFNFSYDNSKDRVKLLFNKVLNNFL